MIYFTGAGPSVPFKFKVSAYYVVMVVYKLFMRSCLLTYVNNRMTIPVFFLRSKPLIKPELNSTGVVQIFNAAVSSVFSVSVFRELIF